MIVPLGARPVSGGNYQATWSIRPGVRVHMLVPAEAYASGALPQLGRHIEDRFGPGSPAAATRSEYS